MKLLQQQQKEHPRVLFFGMEGNFSYPSLQALLKQDVDVCAVVLPASPLPGRKMPALQRREQPRSTRSALPLIGTSSSRSIVQLATQKHIPVWYVYRLSATETIETLAAYQADLICVACFSQRIPRFILQLPRLGCLNIHPSLLPANRGPVPLFWTFREGNSTTGITIHMLNEGMDSGDILAQETIRVPNGITYDELEMQCATRGGTLLAHAVQDVYAGKATFTRQDETQSSYHSFPGPEDFVVHPQTWSARHLYNFIRGMGHWDQAVELHLDNGTIFVRDVTSYSHEPTNGQQKEMVTGRDRQIVQCKDGWVVVVAPGGTRKRCP